jgi:hypothetical protein
MTVFLICIAIYIFWTIVGVVFFLNIMGYKFRKSKLYDWLIGWPVMPIAYIIGWMGRK